MKKTIASNRITNQVAMAGNGAKAIMNVGAVAGLGFVAYLGVKVYGKINDAVPSMKDSMSNLWDWGFGVKTDADGNIIPNSVIITNADGNEETVVNRFHEVPVIGKVWPFGGLYQWGMELGASNNPFQGEPAPPPPPPPPRLDKNDIYEAWAREEFFKEHGYYEYDSAGAWAAQKKASDEAAESWDKYNRENNPDYGNEVDVPTVEIDIDITPDPTQTGSSPVDSTAPMNWMAWYMWVDVQGWPNPWGRIDKDVVIDGYTMNLSWHHVRYLEFWNANFGR